MKNVTKIAVLVRDMHDMQEHCIPVNARIHRHATRSPRQKHNNDYDSCQLASMVRECRDAAHCETQQQKC